MAGLGKFNKGRLSMLSSGTVVAMVAVSDRERGKQFYGETLGLELTEESPGATIYTVGGGQLIVYASDTAGTGDATAAAFIVDDVDATVEDLKAKGLSFERYEIPGVDSSSDVHTIDMGDGSLHKAAWFKDPDGNILGLNSR